MMTPERKAEIDSATKNGHPLILTEQELYDYWKLEYFPGMTDDQIAAVRSQIPFAGA